MIRCVVVLVLVGLASAQKRDVSFWDCGSKANVSSLQIEPCDSDPCVLRKGKTSRVYFSIISDQDTKTAWLSGKFKLWIIPVTVPNLSQDLCKKIISCPIAKGERYDGSMRVTIPSYAPSMKTTVEFKISGDKGSSVCIKANVLIR